MKKFVWCGLVSVLLFLVGCTTYVQPGQQGYVQPMYDPGLSVVVVGGQQGYYDGYHHFHTMVVINGASGYYGSRGEFVSNAPSVREAAQSHKPLYTGRSSSNLAPQTTTTQTSGSKPDYGSNGTVGRGSSTSTSNAKPNYGGGGTATRGNSSTPAPTSRPNYGGGGSVTRSSSPSPSFSRPSYGSSGGGSVSRGRR